MDLDINCWHDSPVGLCALSDNLRSNGVRSFVETSVDLATVRPDHRLVACDFSLGHGEGGNWA